MVCYNFFVKLSKLILFSLFIISFIVVCLLLCSSSVKAVTYETAYSSASIQDIETAINSIYENENITDAYWFCAKMGSSWFINIYNTNDLLYYDTNAGRVKTDNNVLHTWWYMYAGGTYQYGGSDGGKINALMAVDNNLPFFYGNVPLYHNDKTTIFWSPNSSANNLPYVVNPTTDLVSGDFAGFMVVSDESFDFLSFHLSSLPQPTTNHFDEILDHNSPYFISYSSSLNGDVYIIPKTCLPNGYQNSTEYTLFLGYDPTGFDLTTTPEITWTTNFSATALENLQIEQQAQINQSIVDIESILTNKNYDSNDIDVPTYDVAHSTAYNYGNDLFDRLFSAFTSDEYTDFVFNIPFSSASITIPSNYIESHCPTVIVNIIRLFYYYIISRYILKDLLRTLDKMRQGNWLVASESNIKTEVL